jgi:amidase
MPFSEYAAYDGLGLAKLVREKQVRPIELVDAAIARIDKHNPTLNAVIWSMFDRARAIARKKLPDGPFKGVPFLLKDSLGDLEGAPTRQASRLISAVPRAQTALLTQRFLRAGLIPLGKTNVPEFALLPTTESLLYGPARNPWDIRHTTGGSSGGSAAAVAAGMVPVAHANDGGGSIRIPASCCGLVGLKPTRARTSFGPELGEGWGGLEVEHIVSRSVRDTAAMLDATAGGVAGDPYWAPPPPKSYLAAARKPAHKLRVALIRSRSDRAAPHADCIAAVDHAARLCRSLGHRVEVVDPPAGWAQAGAAWVTLYASSLVAQVEAICESTGATPSADTLEGFTLALHALGQTMTAAQYQRSINALHAASRAVALWHEPFDVALTPTLGTPPLLLGEVDATCRDLAKVIPKLLEFVPFTSIQNSTGQPAISLPLYMNAAGLPIGVHFIGRFGDEVTLLRLATQLERADPWKDRHPPIWD